MHIILGRGFEIEIAPRSRHCFARFGKREIFITLDPWLIVCGRTRSWHLGGIKLR
jgi:hypothetical protein